MKDDVREITVSECFGVLRQLGGKAAMAPILQAAFESRQLALYKFCAFTLGQLLEAVPNILGGADVVIGLIEGKLEVEIVDDTLFIKPALKPLFDRHGRRIPPAGFMAMVRDADPQYRLDQVGLSSSWMRLDRLADAGLSSSAPASAFATEANWLVRRLQENEQTKNLLNGVYLPIVIPQTRIDDYGREAEKFVSAAGVAYCREFPDRSFTNRLRGDFNDHLTIVAGSRHEQLINRIARGWVVGIYFPNPLQSFSVEAQRQQMSSLPQGFLLSGVIDTAMAWVMYPDDLGRDIKVPTYNCSANQWSPNNPSASSLKYSPYMRVIDDGRLVFDGSCDLAVSVQKCSGGLLYIRQ